MKKYSKIMLLVALIMLVSLSACERAASLPPVTTLTTGAGEVPFPVGTQDLSAIGTQTAIASTPLPELPTPTPQVLVATETPGAQPADAGQPTATADANAGGGVAQPAQPAQPAEPVQQPLVATPVVERPATYTLKKGEFPFCIARRFDLDLSALLSANNLNVNSQLATGYNLRIPASGNWPSSYGSRALKAHPVDYTVVAGETVYSIACKFGDVTPEAILAVNGINEDGIQAGTTIRIP